MAKSDEKRVRSGIESEKGRVSGASEKYLSEKEMERPDIVKRTNELREGVTGGYKNFAETGGLTPTDEQAIGGFRNFATTGGVTPDTIARYRSRASDIPTAYYGRLSEGLRRGAVTGGYTPGYSTAQARLARYSSQDAAKASRDAELELSNMIRSGQLAGIQGLQGAGQGIASRRLAGIGGLQGQYESTPGELGRNDLLRLQAMGMESGDVARLLGLQAEMSHTPGLFDNILRGAGAAAGVVTGVGGLR